MPGYLFYVGKYWWWFRRRAAVLNNGMVYCIIPSGDELLAQDIAAALNAYVLKQATT
jgi:hypothetical protein